MKIEIFTLCEFANADPKNGKMNITGTFDRLGGIQAPIMCPLCAIAIRVRFGVVEIGVKKIRLSFIDADGTPVMPTLESPLNVQIQPGDSTAIVPFVMIMQQIKLPHFGEYSISLAIDGSEIGAIPLIVRQIQLPGSKGKPPESEKGS